jgi:adenylate cyclase
MTPPHLGPTDSLPPDKRIKFRIGINVDDIIVQGSDISGDGANVAARLEGIAEPGAFASAAPCANRPATASPSPSPFGRHDAEKHRSRGMSELLIIARNSTFTDKGNAVDVKQVGRDLGVGFVLEGSVRKAGNRVRVTASSLTPRAVRTSGRFDRDLTDIQQKRVLASHLNLKFAA